MDGKTWQDDEQLMTTPEDWKRLNVSNSTFWKIFASGDIATIKVGGATRVAPADLRDFLERNRRGVLALPSRG